MTPSDEDLVKQCLNGEQAAFGFLVDKYKGAVHALARKKLRNHHDAEDVAQEAFLKAYQNLPSLKEPSRFAGWLYVITTHECNRRIRKRTSAEKSHSALADLSRHNSSADRETERLRNQVRDAIAALPESNQTIIHLYYFAGLSCEEISRFLGASKNAVKMRLSRTRTQLKKEMIDMLEQLSGIIPLPAQFTTRMMERIEGLRFRPPKPVQSSPVVRFSPFGVMLLATIVIGLGMYSQITAIPPTSWEGNRAIDVPIEFINLPSSVESPNVGRPTLNTASSASQSIALQSPLSSQHGNKAQGSMAVAEENDDSFPHISGVVVDKKTGQPISSALIFAEGREGAQTMTDNRGKFSLNADVGHNPIGIKATGYGFRFVQFPGNQKIVKGLRVELNPGITVEGSVIDDMGIPIANARVRATVGVSYGRIHVADTKTNVQGKYSFEDVNPLLPYYVEASHPEYVSDSQYSDAKNRRTFLPALGGTTVPPLILYTGSDPHSSSLSAQARNVGRQQEPATGVTIRGFIQTEEGIPIRDATVRFGTTDNSGPHEVIAATDHEGVYLAENVVSDAAHLVVKAPGFSPFHKPIDLREGTEFEIDVTLLQSAVFEGIVVEDLTGHPIPFIQILLRLWYHEHHPGQPPDILDLQLSAQTDVNGQFVFNQVPNEGAFQIDILHTENFTGQSHQFKSLPRGFINFVGFAPHYDESSLELPVVFRLKRGAHMKVRVLDAETDKPITNFFVSFGRSNTQDAFPGIIMTEWIQETEHDGSHIYSKSGVFVSPSMPEGSEVNLAFRANGYAPAIVERAKSRVNPNTINLSLERAKVLRERVVDVRSREPIENAWIKSFGPSRALRLHSGVPETTAGASVLSNDEGHFTLDQMHAGSNSLFIKHPNYAPKIHFEVNIEIGDAKPLVVELSQGGVVAGTSAAGKLIAIAFADHLYDAQEPPGERPYFELISVTKTDNQGHFRFEQVPTGKHFLGIIDHLNPRLEINWYEQKRGEAWPNDMRVHLIEVREGTLTQHNLDY